MTDQGATSLTSILCRTRQRVCCGNTTCSGSLRSCSAPPSGEEGKSAFAKAERRGRDAHATIRGIRLRQGYGATRCCTQLGGPIRFCETNPPFCEGDFDVSFLFTETYAVCSGICRWVRFGKTNPISGVCEVVFMGKWVRFMETKPLGNLLQTWFEDDVGLGATGSAATMRNDGKRDARPTSGSEQV